MRKWLKIASLLIVIVATIVLLYMLNLMFTGFIDGSASFGSLRTEQTSDNEVTFTIDGDVYDWYSNPVKFSDCAYGLMVDNRTISSDEYAFREFINDRWIDMEYTKVHGPGTFNATFHADQDTNYIVIFFDLDKNECVSAGDNIVVRSTDPIQSDVVYRFFLATDIQNGRGHANYIGTINGPQPSGW